MKLFLFALLVQAVIVFLRLRVFKRLKDSVSEDKVLDNSKETMNKELAPTEKEDPKACSLHDWGTSTGVLACKNCGFKAGE
jgi:hypothetical protein